MANVWTIAQYHNQHDIFKHTKPFKTMWNVVKICFRVEELWIEVWILRFWLTWAITRCLLYISLYSQTRWVQESNPEVPHGWDACSRLWMVGSSRKKITMCVNLITARKTIASRRKGEETPRFYCPSAWQFSFCSSLLSEHQWYEQPDNKPRWGIL